MRLVSSAWARRIDAEASAEWGLHEFALVEAAGRACAAALLTAIGGSFAGGRPRIVALTGTGNNGADSLVLLRALILAGKAEARDALVLHRKESAARPADPRSPYGESVTSVRALGVAYRPWDAADSAILAALREADLLIDGISGTGIDGPLRGGAAEMADAIGRVRREGERRATVVSVDVPSGIGDDWKKGMTAVAADITLAIEPVKGALFLPNARPFAGKIVPVGEIFPEPLLRKAEGASLTDFSGAAARIPPVAPSAYKYERGVVEIRAGSAGAVGAASLAARGAQAAGAGLVRLVVDAGIRDILAVASGGVMVATAEEAAAARRFSPDCVLAGPGWGRSAERRSTLDALTAAERDGLALVLDADAVSLSKGRRFAGNAILTPHPGELAEYLDVEKDELLDSPDAYLPGAAERANAVLVMKGHVTRISAPDGRIAIVDGMAPVLAMGGSGDVLAGLTAAIAARLSRYARAEGRSFDPFDSAVAASALLAEAGRTVARETGFCDPSDVARVAGRMAASVWLGGGADGTR